MKKLIALLLMAVLVFPMALVAGAQETEMTLYEGDGFALEYPADWIVMDQKTMDSVVELVTSGKIPGMDASTLQVYMNQIETTNMTMITAADGSMNFNVIPQDLGQSVSNDLILAELVPSVLSQYASTFPDFDIQDKGSKTTYGSNEFVKVGGKYVLMNVPMVLTQLMCSGGTSLYIITFTVTENAVEDMDAANATIEAIAASFKAQ